MRVRVLGCNGGIGGGWLRTTSLLVDQDILIDAGTGLTDLTLAELANIDHVFITHSHLDHIAALPLAVDAVADLRETPMTIYATAEILEALRKHIFNWEIWPDFGEIALREQPVLRYRTLCEGEAIRFGERTIRALPAEHTVPALGYQIDSGAASLVFTGDTTVNERFWPIVNAIDNLRYLIVETAFPDRDKALAEVSKHLCPTLLKSELDRLKRPASIYITHLKPRQSKTIMDEIDICAGNFNPLMLENGQVFEF